MKRNSVGSAGGLLISLRVCQMGLLSPPMFGDFCRSRFSGPNKQPKHKVFGRDIPGTSGTKTSGYSGQKLYASGLFLLF